MSLFKKQPELLNKDTYRIQSNVSLDVLDRLMSQFYGAEGKETWKEEEREQFKVLCDELGFPAFEDEVHPVPDSGGSNMRKEVLCLKGCTSRHEMILEKLQRQVIELERRLEMQNETIQRMASTEKTLTETIQALQNEIQNKEMNGPVRELTNEANDKVSSSANDVSLGARNNAEPGTTFVYRPAQPLRGIIAHLSRKIDGNVYTKGVVIVHASSCHQGDCRSLVDFQEPRARESHFSTNDRPNSWIVYDFKDRRVTPTSYSIRSWSAGAGSCHPRSWVFEVSMNGETWEIVDCRENNNNLNDSLAIDNFSINPVPNGRFRFIRLRQTGKNHNGNDRLCISSLEVFGTLTEKPQPVARRNEFLCDEREPLRGIIAHLERKCGGNVYDKGVVVMTAGSTATNERDNWCCYDFRERRIKLASYSFKSDGRGSSLVSWFVDVSNDGETWEVVDCHHHRDLNKVPLIRNFRIKHKPKGTVRFIRFHQFGKNLKSKDGVFIQSFEVFGVLTDKPRPVRRHGEICFDDCKPLAGIIARLTNQCHGNVHLRRVVDVTSSGCCRVVHPMFATIEDPNKDFISHDKENSWICYDFKGRRVTPTSYSISCAKLHLRSWVFEVSNDGQAWDVVDQHENFDWSSSKIQNFPINPEPSQSFRFVRLRQTGQNDEGNNRLYIRCLEVFGILTNIPPPVSHPGEFPFYDLYPLGGIIAHLLRQCRKNVDGKGAVEVTASSVSSGNPAGVTRLWGEYHRRFSSCDKQNSWICYDFKEKRVTPTSYSIEVDDRDKLKSWVFEVSNDGKKWQAIDHHKKSNELAESFVICNFPITCEVRDSFRFVRLRQTGKNHSGYYNLCINSLEIFGMLSNE